jgi:aspartyl/glutamyl-tRNA(Asn/Gln) amidotransferase C subunit
MISSAKIAKLANLPIGDPSSYDQKLEETVAYVEILKEIQTVGVDPTFQVGNGNNRVREDVVEPERMVAKGEYKSKIVWE